MWESANCMTIIVNDNVFYAVQELNFLVLITKTDHMNENIKIQRK